MRRKVRRLALIGGLTFVVASAALHFTLGSAIATYFPAWRAAAPPDQAISIISISRNVREERHQPPTPPPTAPPKIATRVSSHLAPLRYREITSFEKAQLASIRAPARRKADLYVVGPKRTKPGTEDAPGATNAVEPTPSPGYAGAKVDTGGTNDETVASVWGDDNPPRVLQAATLTLSTAPPKPVRIAVDVGPDGNVISVRIIQSSGDPQLDQQALDAARKTVFAPATANGIPVHGSIVLEYPPAATTGST
jgi:TonB family protein